MPKTDNDALVERYLNSLTEENTESRLSPEDNSKLMAFLDSLGQQNEPSSATVVIPTIKNKLTDPITRLDDTIRNALNFGYDEDHLFDPRINKKSRSDWFEIDYKLLRNLALSNSNTLTIENYPTDDPLFLFPSKKAKEKTLYFSRNDNIWIGPTKASLYILYDKGPSIEEQKKNSKQTAAFSMAVESVSFVPNEEADGTLTITLFNKVDKNSSFPDESFNQYIPLQISDARFDNKSILIGRFVNPESVNTQNVVSNVLNGLSYDVINGLIVSVRNSAVGLYDTTTQSLKESELWCCMLFQLLKNSPEALEDIEEWNEDVNEASERFEKIKIYLQTAKQIIVAILGLLDLKYRQTGWPTLLINLNELSTNTVALILLSMIDVLKDYLVEQSVEWVEKTKKDIKENTGEFINCLPWETMLSVIVNSIFGRSGFFKSIQAFIKRITNMIIIKAQNRAMLSSYESGEPDKIDTTLVPTLKGMVLIIDMLLAVNLQGLTLCENYKGKKDNDGELSDDGSSIINSYGGGTTTEEEGDSTEGNTGGSTGFNRYSTGIPSGSKIDITNTDIDPIALLILKEDAEIQKFMTQYMGLSADNAAEALSNAKTGECLKEMSSSDVAELQSILKQAGTNI